MTGYRWQDVEDMRLPDLMALTKWWGKHPPMAYAGGKSESSGDSGDDDRRLTDDDLVAMLGG